MRRRVLRVTLVGVTVGIVALFLVCGMSRVRQLAARAKYDRIQPGMSFSEVTEVMGRECDHGGLNHGILWFSWVFPDGQKINVEWSRKTGNYRAKYLTKATEEELEERPKPSSVERLVHQLANF